jgi:predicted Zn finger-like uncharacterized protein
MQVQCPKCGTLIRSDDINLANMAAKCRRCDSLLDLKPLLSTAGEGADHAPAQRPIIPTPRGFRIDETARGLRIVRRWFAPGFLILALFCIAWDSFLVFWYFMAFANWNWMAILFPILHLAIGVGLTYTALTGFVNRTVITVEDGQLTVRHGPLPWPGNRRLSTAEIGQLFTEQNLQRSNNGQNFTYRLCAVMNDGRKEVVLAGSEEMDDMLFLEQRLEAELGIKDRPVVGEVPR